MTTGACIIDGTDIASMGMFILRGGDAGLLAFPNRKEPPANEWFEYDGLEVDYDLLKFAPKQVEVEYYLKADDKTAFTQRLNAFETLHYAAGLRHIEVREFNQAFDLQFIEVSRFQMEGGLYKQAAKRAWITVRYRDNNPDELFQGTGQASGNGYPTHVLINGSDLSVYGIVIREVYNTALATRKPRTGMLREIAHINGAIADTGFVPKREGNTINMECTLLAGDITEFWANYIALFNVLSSTSGPLILTLDNGKEIRCYYQSMSNVRKDKSWSQRVKLDFTLRFTEV
ncbi:MAG: hypothetical protein PWQ06_2056 [Anaerophaga sp.]|nr:hypothetical protein [Anaerophaga sp.]